MADLKLNSEEPNEEALNWLKEAKASAPAHYLHLLTLAAWGLENGAEGEWPAKDRHALAEQVNILHGWKPDNVMFWLTNNPNGPDQGEQERDLLAALHGAASAEEAAGNLLGLIYSRQVADNPALQPAASE